MEMSKVGRLGRRSSPGSAKVTDRHALTSPLTDLTITRTRTVGRAATVPTTVMPAASRLAPKASGAGEADVAIGPSRLGAGGADAGRSAFDAGWRIAIATMTPIALSQVSSTSS